MQIHTSDATMSDHGREEELKRYMAWRQLQIMKARQWQYIQQMQLSQMQQHNSWRDPYNPNVSFANTGVVPGFNMQGAVLDTQYIPRAFSDAGFTNVPVTRHRLDRSQALNYDLMTDGCRHKNNRAALLVQPSWPSHQGVIAQNTAVEYSRHLDVSKSPNKMLSTNRNNLVGKKRPAAPYQTPTSNKKNSLRQERSASSFCTPTQMGERKHAYYEGYIELPSSPPRCPKEALEDTNRLSSLMPELKLPPSSPMGKKQPSPTSVNVEERSTSSTTSSADEIDVVNALCTMSETKQLEMDQNHDEEESSNR